MPGGRREDSAPMRRGTYSQVFGRLHCGRYLNHYGWGAERFPGEGQEDTPTQEAGGIGGSPVGKDRGSDSGIRSRGTAGDGAHPGDWDGKRLACTYKKLLEAPDALRAVRKMMDKLVWRSQGTGGYALGGEARPKDGKRKCKYNKT